MRSAACEYPEWEDRPDGQIGVNDVDHGGEGYDPADFAAIIAWARAWHASASPEERAWLRVQLRRAIPDLADDIYRQDAGPIFGPFNGVSSLCADRSPYFRLPQKFCGSLSAPLRKTATYRAICP
jgi:hypothetical protein